MDRRLVELLIAREAGEQRRKLRQVALVFTELVRERLLELLHTGQGAANDVAAARGARVWARTEDLQGCEQHVRELTALVGLELQLLAGREVRNQVGRPSAAARAGKLRQR